jgi:hypothetical protein
MISVLFLSTFVLNAQSPFSGKWILDHSKSDAEFRDYEITLVITQTLKSFTAEQTLTMKNGEKSVMPAVSYNLDGKEVIKEEEGGTSKLSAEWSTDKKTLTIKFVRSMNGNDFGSKTSYNLSDDGRILSIKATDLNGESPMVQVYSLKLP